MLKVIRELLLQIINNIDAGNSNLSEEQELEVLEYIKRFTDKKERLSKYKACEYLNVSRATFDNYIREGKLPKGTKEPGFNELSWTKKELDEYKNKFKK
jgi:predicted DNA-binding transcriptional regulator AlpA